MKILARVVTMLVGLVLAGTAGFVFALVAAVTTGFGEGGPAALFGVALFAWLMVTFGATQAGDPAQLAALLGALLLLPMATPGALVALLAEAFGWRSMTVHMAANAGLGALTAMAWPFFGGGPHATAWLVSDEVMAVMAATGGVVGFVYWAIAGRHATGFLASSPSDLTAPPPPAR